LAAKLEQDLGAEVHLIASSGGVFEVVVDGTLVYSKKATGTFPDDGRLVASIRRG